MTVYEDILSTDSGTVLLKAGVPLDARKLERINDTLAKEAKDKDAELKVMVSLGTERALMERLFSVKIPDKREIERHLGYDKMLAEAGAMISFIEANEALPNDCVMRLREMIKACFSKASLSDIFTLIHLPVAANEILCRHLINTSLLNGLIGWWLNVSQAEIDQLLTVGLLHDCGMALFPKSIIEAPRNLTVFEYEAIKLHSVRSFDLMEGFTDIERYGVRDHHERLNLTGYPDGVGGASISFAARVTAVSDVYCARVSRRAWREAESPFDVAFSLSQAAGVDFDEEIINIFLSQFVKEFNGRYVRLSSGEMGVVQELLLSDIMYPLVKIGGVSGSDVKTSDKLWCSGLGFSRGSGC